MVDIFGSMVSKGLALLTLIGFAGLAVYYAKVPDQIDAGNQLQAVANQAKVFLPKAFMTNAAAPGCGLPAGGVVAASAGGVIELTTECIGMPAAWQNTNPFGQTHVLKVYQPNPGLVPPQVYGLVQTCGGDVIHDVDALKAAGRARPDGGALTSLEPTEFVSSGGKWRVPASVFDTPGCPAAPGHLAALVVVDGGQAVPPFLHRFNVDGTKEPATMHVPLYMAGNRIEEVRDVVLTDGRSLASAVLYMAVVEHGAVIQKPECSVGSPQIVLAVAGASAPGTGRPMVGIWPRAIDNAPAKTWTVDYPIFTKDEDGGGTEGGPAGQYGKASVFVNCQ